MSKHKHASALSRAATAAMNAGRAATSHAASPAAPTKGVVRPLTPPPQNITVTGPLPPPVDPFFTADDIIQMNNWLGQVDDQRSQQVEPDFQNAKTDEAYQTQQVAQQATQAASQATDNMIARGLFSSSVKDAAMYDITAQKNLQQGLLQDQLHNAMTAHDTWVSRYGGTMSDGTQVAATPEEAQAKGLPLGTAVAAWSQAWQAKAGENAKGVNDTRVAPTQTIPNPIYQHAPDIHAVGAVVNHTQGDTASNATPASVGSHTLVAAPGAPGAVTVTNRKAKTRTTTNRVVTP